MGRLLSPPVLWALFVGQSREFWQRFRQPVLGTSAVVIGQSLYFYIQRHTVSTFQFANGLDEAIPLWPFWILIYISIIPMFIRASFILEREAFNRTLLRVIIGHLLTFPFFYFYPASYPREALGDIGPIYTWLFDGLRAIDLPNNTFPSMHVSMTWIIMHELGRTPWRKFLAIFYAALVTASVLLTKQHFILDIFGGLAIYSFSLHISNLLYILDLRQRILNLLNHLGPLLSSLGSFF